MITLSARSTLLALGLGFTLATCFDESVLENEECASNADCASSQECVRTEYQATASSEAYGWCRPKGEGCAVGSQPGCECLIDGGLRTCTKHTSETNAVCPSSGDDDCLCVFPSSLDIDPPPTDNSFCPSS